MNPSTNDVGSASHTADGPGRTGGPVPAWCPWVTGRRRALAWKLEVAGEALAVIVVFAMSAAVVPAAVFAVLAYTGVPSTRAAAANVLALLGGTLVALGGLWLAVALAERLVLGRPRRCDREHGAAQDQA